MHYIHIIVIWSFIFSSNPINVVVKDINAIPIAVNFKSPVNYPIVLAGNFGEIRNTHLHAGIDIKPQMGEGKDQVFAVESGYVSRIKISRSGYGKALYITHQNGFTTVYAHLSSYDSIIDTYIHELQKSVQSYEVEVYPDSKKFKIEKGAIIGFLGNSGRSYGAHLHFEIRETDSEEPINPLKYGIGPSDTKAPTISSISIHSLNDQFDKVDSKRNPVGESETELDVFCTTDIVGLSIECFDLMDGATNKNGIYSLKLFSEDTLIYQMKLDKFSFSESSKVAAFVDYETKILDKKTDILCYKLPSNSLQIVTKAINAGMIDMKGRTQRNIKIEISDFAGNISQKRVNIIRSSYTKNLELHSGERLFINQPYIKSIGNLSISIPKNSLIRNLDFTAELLDATEELYSVGNPAIGMIKDMTLEISIPPLFQQHKQKLMLVQLDDGEMISYGEKITGNVLSTNVEDFGLYKLVIDSIAPYIIPGRFSKNSNSRLPFTFELKDNIETKGKAKDFEYDVWIDDRWRACEYKSLTNFLTVPISNLALGKHTLKITTKDYKGNAREFKSSFTIK